MPLESQGVILKIADGTVATASDTGLEFNATGINSTGTDFTTDFSTGMRLRTNSTLSTRIVTADAVASSAISIYEACTVDNSSAFNHLNGYTMNPIGQVVSFTGPSGGAAIIDITHLGSTAKEKLIGLADWGNLTFEMFFDSSATSMHTELKNAHAAREQRYFEIELTDGTLAGTFLFFAGYVTGFSISGAVDDAIKGSVGLEITEQVHWTKTTR